MNKLLTTVKIEVELNCNISAKATEELKTKLDYAVYNANIGKALKDKLAESNIPVNLLELTTSIS